MTANQAYKAIKERNKGAVCIECQDFGDFYGFVFVPKGTPKGEAIGGAYDTVDKKTGKISTYNPITNLALLDKAVPVDLATLS